MFPGYKTIPGFERISCDLIKFEFDGFIEASETGETVESEQEEITTERSKKEIKSFILTDLFFKI